MTQSRCIFFFLFYWIVNLTFVGATPSTSQKKHFKWENVSYQGGSCITLRCVKKFYGFTTFQIKNNKITLKNKHIKLTLGLGSLNCRMNGILFILSHPIIHSKGRYLISKTDLLTVIHPVLRPAQIKHKNAINTIVIDAGHGGYDSGSNSRLKPEKYYTLKVAKLLRDILKKQGFNIIMTRKSDVFISLDERARIANQYPDAIFISIHFNSGAPNAHGIETFTISPVGTPHLDRGFELRDNHPVPGNLSQSASIALATVIHSRTLIFLNHKKYGNNFHMLDRGIKHARFNVLTNIKIPAILFEGGFLSNPKEVQKINSDAYQKTLATAISYAINIYKNSLSPKKKTSKKTPPSNTPSPLIPFVKPWQPQFWVPLFPLFPQQYNSTTPPWLLPPSLYHAPHL